MVIRKMKKYGFSLAEVLISMLIMSVFFLATSKIMTTKQNPEIQENPHGFYECYIKDGNLTQKQMFSGVETPEKSVDACNFTPPQGLAFVTIYAVRDANHIYKSVEPQFNSPIAQISSRNALINFYQQIEDIDPNESDLTLDDLYNFLEIAYPKSGLYALMRSGPYQNPALFIGW